MVSYQNNEETISLFEGLERSDYSTNAKNVLASLFFDYFSTPQSKLYLLTKQVDNQGFMTNSYFVLQHKLKIPVGERSFDVPLLIYLPDAFPLGMPEIYIERRGNIEINPKLPNGLISSQDLRIHYEYYMKWSKEAEGVMEVLRYLSGIFLKGFPIYSSRRVIEYTGNCMLIAEQVKRIMLEQSISVSDNSIMNTTNSSTTISSKSSNGKNSNTNTLSSKDFETPGFEFIEIWNIKGNEDGSKKETMRPEDEIESELKANMTNKLIQLLQSKQKNQRDMYKLLTKTKVDLEKTVMTINGVINKQKEILEIGNNLPKKLEQNNQIMPQYNGGYEELLLLPIEQKCMAMIEITNPKTMKHLLNEMTLEEMLQLVKNLFDKNMISLADGIQTTRVLSYQLFKMKEGQRKYSHQRQ